MSHPVRGAWIEIPFNIFMIKKKAESHPVRGAWIEIFGSVTRARRKMSHPVRGAWIEMRMRLDEIRRARGRIP